jgi:hypothetical protein
LFYNPTVLAGVTPQMAAYQEEIFGPVAVIVPFDTDEEAIAMANDTDYGLSAAVISRDVARAMAIGDRLHSGLLHINDQTVNDDVVNPFGGVGASGNGTSIGGPANWEEFTHGSGLRSKARRLLSLLIAGWRVLGLVASAIRLIFCDSEPLVHGCGRPNFNMIEYFPMHAERRRMFSVPGMAVTALAGILTMGIAGSGVAQAAVVEQQDHVPPSTTPLSCDRRDQGALPPR